MPDSLLDELVAALVEDGAQRLQDIREALHQQDSEALARSAHQLAGAMGNCSAVALEQLARRLIACAHTGRMDDAAGLLPALEARLERLSHQVTAA